MESERTPVPPRRASGMEDTIDLKEIFYLLLHKWKPLLVAMLIGATLFGAYCTFMLKPTYRADASIYMTNTDSMITISDLQLGSALTEDYTHIIKSRTVLRRVINDLDLNLNFRQLASLITVNNPGSSHIIQIYVTTGDPEMSRNIANSLLNIGISQISQVIGSNTPTVIDPSIADAVVEQQPSLQRYVLMGAMAGFALVAAILIVRMLLDTTMKSEEDIEKYLKVSVLSSIPYYKGSGKED